jgi:LPS export ABC transporter protein LptC
LGKKIVIAGFLVCLALAFYVFLTREDRTRKDAQAEAQKQPRVVLEDFSIYRYEAEALVGKLTSRLGHFYEPNIVELDGEVRGERINGEGERETLGAESATAYMKSNSLMKLMDQTTELDRAELNGFVEVGLKEHLLSTDYAEFVNSDKLVRSPRPVRVEGPGRVFMGDEGFQYEVETQILEMKGPVKGVVSIEGQ